MDSLALPPNIQALSHVFHRINDLLVPITIDSAVYNDLHGVIKAYKSSRLWTVGAMGGAATRGRLDIVRRLFVTRNEGCSSSAFIGVAGNNHLDVLRWLHTFFPENSRSTEELSVAAANGHLQIVQYLSPIVTEDEVGPAMEAAAVNGHVAVVEALLPGPLDVKNILVAAASHGQVQVLQLLLERDNFIDAYSVLLEAAQFGSIRVMELVIDVCEQNEIGNALLVAAQYDQAGAVKILMERRPNEQTIEYAILISASNECCCALIALVEL